MTRRHDALIPLTHDHHHALKNARRLRQAADGDDRERSEAARAFVRFFTEDSVQHFREEEEEIFPLVIDKPGAPLSGITRVLLEHVRLHALRDLLDDQVGEGVVDPELMRTTSDLLKQHVRFEEDELFPAIERCAGDQLSRVRLKSRDRGSED
jgi:hemerythrin-like domain-containing protein